MELWSACRCVHEDDGLADGTNSIQLQCSIEGFTFSAQDINHRESTSVTLQSDQDVEQYTSVNTPWLELREATA